MILIITTLVITIFVIISIYYINNIQKKAQIITTKQLEHMTGLYTDEGSNLHLLLSEDYKKQFIKDGIKNFNQSKIIENGVIKLKGGVKTDYEKIRHTTDDAMLDKFFKEISKSLLPYTTKLKGENVETIKLDQLEKLLQLILDGKKQLNKGITTTMALISTTNSSNVVETFLSQSELKDKLKNESNNVIKPSSIDFKFKELDIQKMVTSIFNEMKNGIPTENNNIVTTTKDNYIYVDKDKITDYLRSFDDKDIATLYNSSNKTGNNIVNTTSQQKNNIELFTSSTDTSSKEPYEFKYNEKDKKEEWKIENPDTFEYIDDPKYPNADDEEYYQRNTEEYNKEQQDHYERITLLNEIEISKQKWLYSKSCKQMLEKAFIEDFKKAYHNYMIYAFTNVLKYLPAIENPTQLTVTELKAYNLILKQMPKCSDLVNLFENNIDKLNCGNNKSNTNNNSKNNTAATTSGSVKKYKIDLDKNKLFPNNKFNNVNNNWVNVKNGPLPINNKLKTSTNSANIFKAKKLLPEVTTNIDPTTTKSSSFINVLKGNLISTKRIDPTTTNRIDPTTTNRIDPTTTNRIDPTTTNYIVPTTTNYIVPTTTKSILPTFANISTTKYINSNANSPWSPYLIVKAAYSALDYFKRPSVQTTTKKQVSSTTKESCNCPTKENITTNGNVTTTKENVTTTKENVTTTKENIVTTTFGNVITTTIGANKYSKNSKYSKELEMLGFTGYQAYDPLDIQCPVTGTLKNMKPLKILNNDFY